MGSSLPSPAKRQTLPKKLRFEIFKRDSFTCQYCGAQPPAVVLEVDHIHPVAEGGDNAQDNLITACDKCNRGKGKRPLGDKIVRPDADLMWLKTQQETAELKRYRKVKAARDKEQTAVVAQLQAHWFSITDLDWAPSDDLCRRLLANNAPDVIEQAFTVVAPKVAGGMLRSASEWRPYLFAVCRNLTNDTEPINHELKAKVESLESDLECALARLENETKTKRCLEAMMVLALDDGHDGCFAWSLADYTKVFCELRDNSTMLIWEADDEKDQSSWSVYTVHKAVVSG